MCFNKIYIYVCFWENTEQKNIINVPTKFGTLLLNHPVYCDYISL
jgi:hypothetical protein